MNKSDITSMPEYFDRYINLAEDGQVLDILNKYGSSWLEQYRDIFTQLGDKVYAPGKWTVNDIIQHLIDTERVFIYRALAFAREDGTVQPGFDEDNYAVSARASTRSLDDLFEEFAAVRASSITFYKSLSNEMLLRDGIAFRMKISVLAIGFLIAGHGIHHINIIKERYCPLLV
ncbi:MAG: DinB family protein [Ignavibacteria bacterium]|nr:DinB family protein [Ignavibacteria bacterium]